MQMAMGKCRCSLRQVQVQVQVARRSATRAAVPETIWERGCEGLVDKIRLDCLD